MPTCRHGCQVSISTNTHTASHFQSLHGLEEAWSRRRHGLYGFGYVGGSNARQADAQNSSVSTYPHVVFFAGSSSVKGSKQMLQQSLSRSSNSSSLHFSKPFPTSSGDRLGEASDAALGSCSSFFCAITRLIVRETSECTASPTSIDSTPAQAPSTSFHVTATTWVVEARSEPGLSPLLFLFFGVWRHVRIWKSCGRSCDGPFRSHAFVRRLLRS
mmetsp:Transcript_8799/g.54035  ORF Transcript_8799/g.54035 Transcript_8799/m.54035 type:complete len:215 (+) Transcript_8799:1089-1733(+)